MSSLTFVQYLNQLMGLVGGDEAFAILKIQNHRLSLPRVNGMRASPALTKPIASAALQASVKRTLLGLLRIAASSFLRLVMSS
jgi:hypothetical protein